MSMLLETQHAARLNSRVVHCHLQLVSIELIMDLNYNLTILSKATCKNQTYSESVSLVVYSFIEPLREISIFRVMVGIK